MSSLQLLYPGTLTAKKFLRPIWCCQDTLGQRAQIRPAAWFIYPNPPHCGSQVIISSLRAPKQFSGP